MKRVALKMKLNEGQVQEYQKRHDQIWSELSALLKKNGVEDYSIFFDSTKIYKFFGHECLCSFFFLTTNHSWTSCCIVCFLFADKICPLGRGLRGTMT